MDICAGDFNNDGDLDVIANGNYYNMMLFWGNGDGSFAAAVSIPSIATTESTVYDAYDYNRDGKLDIVMFRNATRDVRYCPGNGDGTFGASTALGTTSASGYSISAPAGGVFPFGAPKAIVSPADGVVSLGNEITLNASSSTGAIVSYEWNFGDSNIDTGAVVSHTYADEGIYNGMLKVTDDAGTIACKRFSVTVKGDAPVVDAGGADEDQFNFDEPDSTDAVATHIYDTPDIYNMGLRVWDNGVMNLPDEDPMPSVPAYLTITIEANLPPVCDAGGPYEVDEGTPPATTATASDPNMAGDPLTYEWDLDGDGEFDDATVLNPTHTWDSGTYTITLRVSDSLLEAT